MKILKNLEKKLPESRKEINEIRFLGARFTFFIMFFLTLLFLFFIGKGFYRYLFTTILPYTYFLTCCSFVFYIFFWISKTFLDDKKNWIYYLVFAACCILGLVLSAPVII